MDRNELQKYQAVRDWKLDELVELANRFMDRVAPRQPSDRVAETVNERNARYYMAEGLVDRPLGKEGQASLYGYRHLLQILAVKRLQSNYLPVKKIREILPDKTDRALEDIVLGQVENENVQKARKEAMSFLDSIVSSTPSAEFKKAPGVRKKAPPAPSPAVSPSIPNESRWQRYVLDDGVEIHIREDKISKLLKTEVRRLLDRFFKKFSETNR